MIEGVVNAAYEAVVTLLLFFDKVSILLPGYMYGRHHFADPVLAGRSTAAPATS